MLGEGVTSENKVRKMGLRQYYLQNCDIIAGDQKKKVLKQVWTRVNQSSSETFFDSVGNYLIGEPKPFVYCSVFPTKWYKILCMEYIDVQIMPKL